MAKAASPASLDNTDKKRPEPVLSFEAALQELEAIVQSMEAGTAPLEELLAAYARGVALLKQCQEALATAEQRVRILEEGVLRDFDSPTDADAGD
jgi:exodeoxyribonuclease VII small subunit